MKEITITPKQIAECINNLLDENDHLQQRIYKAINHIENYFEEFSGHFEYDELLKILKGDPHV